MLPLFFHDPELTGRRIVTFSTCRDSSNTNDLMAFKIIGPLLIEIYHYPGPASESRAIPIGNFVPVFCALLRKSCPRNKPIRHGIPVRSTAS